uniref:Myosin light chain alkali n=1 Tax=Timema monikensis TaxID=170555 RepID=A0A7R9HU38_9NEOP|nr:unnamed protein product [Timema monikensis]
MRDLHHGVTMQGDVDEYSSIFRSSLWSRKQIALERHELKSKQHVVECVRSVVSARLWPELATSAALLAVRDVERPSPTSGPIFVQFGDRQAETPHIMGDLSARDIERANFAFSIYDFDGSGTVDAIYLGDVLRALNLNPTLAAVEKLGGTKKKTNALVVSSLTAEDGEIEVRISVGRTEELLEEAISSRSAVVLTDEKKLKVEEFLPIFGQIKKDKDVGCYEDFLECLKLYDKAEDGKMLSAELSHTLLSLGERLSDKEVDDILKDCLDPEDEDGFVPYAPFLKKVVAGPIFETAE